MSEQNWYERRFLDDDGSKDAAPPTPPETDGDEDDE